MLGSVVHQCEGDVLRAETMLRRASETASPADRPYVLDLLAPLLISRGLFPRAATVIASSVADPALETGRLALRAIVDAATGNVRLAGEHAAAARERAARLDDDVLRLRVSQRLAMAAYYRSDAFEALEEVAEGLRAARRLSAHRAACTLHSVAYATYYSLTGDFEAAWREARALAREAELGGDVSCLTLARVAAYELAAERGDAHEMTAVRTALDAEPLPEQYRERFARGIADTLRLAWAGEFATCRNVLIVLKDTVGRSDSERALCRALLALVSIALCDDDGTRRFSRQAISASARPQRNLAAYELRYCRLARALGAIAGDLVGDVVRGRRAADARFLRDDAEVAALLQLCSTAVHSSRMPTSVRGYAQVVDAVRERLALRPQVGPLTETEVEIVRLLASGRNAPQIATLLNRSPHTIRTHIRNASAKLEVHGRIEMLSRARSLGILAEPM
ncbi:MAG: response regulator transcription factor [Candidatus Eremiobacteraeota bacterium]|nr:response regulator transcription factor [Candidatus Eremiobacteraeota bacterium]